MYTLSNLKKKISGGFIKNTGWLLFERIFQMTLSLLVTALTARYLGTHNYGLLSYGLSYIAIFTSICQLGIDYILVNEIIISRKDTGKLIGTTIVMRIVAAFASIILIYFFVAYLNPDGRILQLITFVQSISLIFVSFDTIGYWYQSNLQSKYAVFSKSIAFTIVSIWRLILIYLKMPVYYFAVATILEAAVIGIFLIVFYLKHRGQKLRFSFQTAKKLWSKGRHFLIASLLVTVYTQMDKIMLGQMTDIATVGVYTAALTISNLWIFIPYALIESARPVIMTAKQENETLYIKRYKQLLSAIIWIGIAASCVISLLSKPIILLIYGSGFMESIHILVIIIWSRIFSLIGTTRSIWLISEEKIQFQKYFVCIGAIVNVVLNFLLIPYYGALGASIATICAELLSNTVALLMFKETRALFKLIVDAFLFRDVLKT